MTVSLESSTADIISEKLKLAIFGSSANKSDKRLRQYYNKLLKLERGNAITLADYTLSYRQDNPGLAETALATYGLYLVRFAQKVNKPFGDMTLNDLLGYLETLKKPDSYK